MTEPNHAYPKGSSSYPKGWRERQREQFTDDDQTCIIGSPAYLGTGSRKVHLSIWERLVGPDPTITLVDGHWENAYGEDLSGRRWLGVYYHGGQAAKDLRG